MAYAPSLIEIRALHVQKAARLRRSAEDYAANGLEVFAACDQAEADRAQATANAISVAMRAAVLSGSPVQAFARAA